MGGPEEASASETRQLILARARLGVWLGGLALLIFVPIDYFRMQEFFPAVAATRLVGAILLFAALPFAQTPNAENHAVRLAAWVVLVLSAIVAATMTLSGGPTDPAYLLQVVGVVILILGTSLFLPVDGKQMIVIVSIPLVLHFFGSLAFPLEQNLQYLFTSFVAVIIGTIGAHASHLMRFAEIERRIAKEQLLKANEDFVAMISHDIRNPIGVIQGYASILKEGDLSEKETQDCIRRLESAATTAMLLATNVLSAARLESRGPQLRREPLRVVEVVDRALDGQRLLVENKRIRLSMDVDDELPSFEGDVAELERVFANLMNNAIKYTPEGGEIRVRAAVESREIEIGFEDGGDGIPPGCEETIFDRYNRSSERRDSTGLGLYISRSIVAAHGGRIHAENVPGRGARFVVRLPIG
jgi:signal transduction histidine kinase